MLAPRCSNCDAPLTDEEAHKEVCASCARPADFIIPATQISPPADLMRPATRTPTQERTSAAIWMCMFFSALATALYCSTHRGLYLWLVLLQLHYQQSYYPFYTALLTFSALCLPMLLILHGVAALGGFGDRQQARAVLLTPQKSVGQAGPMLLILGGLLSARMRADNQELALMVSYSIGLIGLAVSFVTIAIWLLRQTRGS